MFTEFFLIDFKTNSYLLPFLSLSQSQTSSPDNLFEKSMMDDFDFVDVEGDIEGELGRSARAKKKDVLEEGMWRKIKKILDIKQRARFY